MTDFGKPQRRFRRKAAGIALVCATLAASIGTGRAAHAQLGPLSPCPNYEYNGSWRLEVANMGCADLPVAAINWAIDAVTGRIAYRFDDTQDGFACVLTIGLGVAGCRNRDGRGFALTGSPTPTAPRPTATRTPTTTSPRRTTGSARRNGGTEALPPSTSRGVVDCGRFEATRWQASNFSRVPSTTWRLRAERSRCKAVVSRAITVTGFLTDPYVGRTFDAGADRCIRTDKLTAICSYNDAGKRAWEYYNPAGRLEPIPADIRVGSVGLYEVRVAFDNDSHSFAGAGLVVPPSEEWVTAESPPALEHEHCLSDGSYGAPEGAPYEGARWEYRVGPVGSAVLDSGTKWRAIGACGSARQLALALTEPLSRSVPTYVSRVEDWTCLTSRRGDLAGAHVISCISPSFGENGLGNAWFTLYQDTRYNDTTRTFLNMAGAFGALGLAIEGHSLPTRITACQPVTSPTRRWTYRLESGRTVSGDSVLLQSNMPCEQVELYGRYLSAEALQLNKDPNRYKIPGIQCRPVAGRPSHAACTVYAGPGLTAKIGVGVVNEYVYASVA